MLTFADKISYLESYLFQNGDNYADSFKEDIAMVLGDFETQNTTLKFLEKLSSKEEITSWVVKLTSRLVLKFDEDSEQLSDFIYDYIALG